MTQAQTQTEELPLDQLPQLLRSAWDEYRRKVQRPVVRIASFNLLVVSHGETDPELAGIVEGLQSSHPSRMIWTKFKPEKSWSESTACLNLVTRCEGQQVCSEQMILRCGNERARIPSIVLPLIHPGLPTHLLWWKAGPLDCPLFRRLQDRCRLVLWQPENTPSSWALEFLDRTWTDPYKLEHATYPLDWFRILGIRKAIAKAYDNGPLRVRTSDPGAEMSLAHRLLKGWLASRLGSDGEVDFRWTSGARGCRIEAPDTAELSLDDPVGATRVALDNAERDPLFAATLKELLTPVRH
jgi:hypothetical protein